MCGLVGALALTLLARRIASVRLERRFFVLEIPQNLSRVQTECHGEIGYQYSMEIYFLDFLHLQPSFRTQNWQAADFIWVAQCVSKVYFHIREHFQKSHEEALRLADTEYLRPVALWAQEHPAYRRFLGANFATVYAMDLGRQDFPGSLELTRRKSGCGFETFLPAPRGSRNWSVGVLAGDVNWLEQVQVFPSVSAPDRCASETESTALGRAFFQQDFVINIPTPFMGTGRPSTETPRPRLAFFSGSLNSCSRRWLYALYGNLDPSYVWINDSGQQALDMDTYRDAMVSSRFCLVLRGSSHSNNVRLSEAMALGCVPVIVSDDFQPPLAKDLDWPSLALFLRSRQLPQLLQILEAADAADARPAMQQRLTGAAAALDYSLQEHWLYVFEEVAEKLDSNSAEGEWHQALAQLQEANWARYVALAQLGCGAACLEQPFESPAFEPAPALRMELLWLALSELRPGAGLTDGEAEAVEAPLVTRARSPATSALAPSETGAQGVVLRLLPAELLAGKQLDEVKFLSFPVSAEAEPMPVLWHSAQFLLSLGFLCFLVASELFLISGGLWRDAFALPSGFAFCAKADDPDLPRLLQAYCPDQLAILDEFKRLYGF
ncbi:unnamed protein product [Effrenium voratum]|nr:unnamed protein product [Effrenium voratum]